MLVAQTISDVVVVAAHLFSFSTRAFRARYANYSSEDAIIRLIINFPLFGMNYSGFSQNLQGTPHAAPHNFIGGHMSTMFSPGKNLRSFHRNKMCVVWSLPC